MISVKDVIKSIKSIIKYEKAVIADITYKGNQIPDYSDCNNNCPKICTLKLDACKKFYKNIDLDKTEVTCPFGFQINHKVKLLSDLEDTIHIYTIVDFKQNTTSNSIRRDIGRKIKNSFDDAIKELDNYRISNQVSINFHKRIVSTLETIMVGRISNAMQALAHQILTPLQGAMSDLENIKDFDRFHKTESVQRLDNNLQNISKIAQQVQMLLSTSTEFTPNMMKRIHIHEIINKILERVKSKAESKHLVINHGYNKFDKIDVIPFQAEIVFDNLIENAVKYSFSGFQNRNLPIKIDYSRDNKFLIVNISNEGVEITPEEIKDRLIFELGYRGVDSADKSRQGTGSGLFIANRIVNMHAGKIDVSCRQVGGSSDFGTDRYESRFSVHLPFYYEG